MQSLTRKAKTEFVISRKNTTAVSILFASLALGGCASMHSPKTTGGAVGQVIRDSSTPEGTTTAAPHVVKATTHTVPLEVWGQKLKVNRFDYPVLVNPAVEHWIAYFTGRGRKYFEKYLERSRYFIPTISKVLKSHNMPQDLVYLAMIESGFNNSAKSFAKAVGPWQFIKGTSQRYGLTTDYWLDERRDTRKSTMAAIGYLKELYQEFGSWELAAAGYNSGENKIRRAIAKYRTTDFWEISRHRFLRRETRDYVPKIMAAAILTKNAEYFGFVNPLTGKQPKPNSAPKDVQTEDNGEELTPKELGEVVESGDTAEDEEREVVSNEPDEVEDEPTGDDAAVVSSGPNPAITPSIYMVNNPNEQIIEYEIKGPSDLFAISKASGLPYSTIKLLNPELLRWCTPPYMKTYRIKLPLSVKDRFLATYNDDSFDRKVVFLKYTVKRGDTVQRVAKHFNIEPTPIRELNSMDSRASNLRTGMNLNLPLPTGYKRVIASMYDDKPGPPSRRRRVRRVRRQKRSTASIQQHHRTRTARLKPNLMTNRETSVD